MVQRILTGEKTLAELSRELDIDGAGRRIGGSHGGGAGVLP